MRLVLILIAVGLLLLQAGGLAQTATPTGTVLAATFSRSSGSRPRVDFETQLKPVFQSKCMPCHFSGGKMYEQLPFDKPATIRKLGTRLFTRIKEENDRRLIEEFLAQTP